MSDVTVTLTSEEALVLFEWLARSSDRGAPAPVVDQAEERVLWVVEGALERSLVALCSLTMPPSSSRHATA
jgi:hypothetical protein